MEDRTKGFKRSKSDSAMKKIEDKLSNILEPCYCPKLKDMGEPKSCVKAKMRQSLGTEVQNSLKEEILHLQKQLEDQLLERSALESALTNRPLSRDPGNQISITKPAEDLIKEIAILELEVVYLEQHLLSLYRKEFDERVSFLSTLDETSKSKSATHKGMLFEVPGHEIKAKNENPVINYTHFLSSQNFTKTPVKSFGEISRAKGLVDSSIYRSNSTLCQRSACSFRTFPPLGTLEELHYHSLPLSMLERADGATSNGTSLAEHLSTDNPDHSLCTPNWLSEEMIKCISAIYNDLAEPPLTNRGCSSSPVSFSSQISDSPQNQYNLRSHEPLKNSSFHPWMDNPFNIEGSKEFSGSYSQVIEVQWICRDSQRLRHVKYMLQNFRSLVSRMKEVDPKKLKHEEKLAFWINVHNALVMHAFLVYGIPHNSLKRMSLIVKAGYNVGGHTISVDMIQNSILRCRLPRPGQWLQSLLFPKTKLKLRDARKALAIDHPEPRLYFALCSGSHSDPAVRMYTPKTVFQELEAAKDDYIQTVFRVHKGQKILLPKILDSFAKESGLCPAGFMEMIGHFMPDSLRKSFQQQQHRHGKSWKRIVWIPHNFAFRYLISKDLSK